MKNKIIVTTLLFFILSISFVLYKTTTMKVFNLKQKTFIFEQNTVIPTDVRSYVDASSRILDEIELNLKNVQNKPGIYKASVSYLDKTYSFNIKIISKKKNDYTLKKQVYEVNIGDTLFADNMVKSLENKEVYFYENEETKQLVKSKTYTTEGVFIERVVIIDNYGNTIQPQRIKVIVHNLIKSEEDI